MTFSSRLPPYAEVNALSRAVTGLRARGVRIVDLTESNPTRVGIPYPEGLLSGLADAGALHYEPHPFGLLRAREAVAVDHARRGVSIDPAQIVLSTSTSEAYSWLFKLLCNPGEAVLVPQPSYPLFEHLTRLEGVHPVAYDLVFHGRWEIDFATMLRAPRDTRAVLAVSPNNPTGSYLAPVELERLTTICRDRGWALIVDEVFADYPLDAEEPVTDVAAWADVLSFTLGGASKTLGLPQVKLAWTIVGGPASARDAALERLELIADTFLSIGTPVQIAAPGLLDAGAQLRGLIHERVRGNLRRARKIAANHPACEVLRVEGGWSAVVRVPATSGEETLVLGLLEQERVLVHPGYFFDFPREAYVVISLLPPHDVFADGFERALRFVHY